MADLGNRRRRRVKSMQVLETAAHVTVYVLDQNVMQWVRAHRKCFFCVDRAQQEIVAKRDRERLERVLLERDTRGVTGKHLT